MVLEGQAALVTGGSSGIGQATAVALAEAGADVAINHLGDDAGAKQTADQITALGRRALILEQDVSDQSGMERVVAAVCEQFGKLDIAVANAYWSKREPFCEADMDGFRRTIEVCMYGSLYTFRAAAQQMIQQGHGGNLIAVSSPHAYIPWARAMAYNMSKAAIDQMARTAALELAPHRIRVNLIYPGWTDTPGERNYYEEEQIAAAGERLPWGRLGRPDEVARGIVFLCDPGSDYITGSSITIHGGITLPWWDTRARKST